jgi:hypothetical protein
MAGLYLGLWSMAVWNVRTESDIGQISKEKVQQSGIPIWRMWLLEMT